MEGIDPDRLREVRGVALTLAENIGWHGETERTKIDSLQLHDVQGTIVTLCREVDDELRAFAAVAEQKAILVETVGNEGSDRIEVDDSLTARLERSLNDGVGSKGIADPDEYKQYHDELDEWLDENPDFSSTEIRAKMDDAAEKGDTKALTQLSEAMVERANGMTDEEGREFLIECGPEAMLTAAELTHLPPTAPVLGALARFATLDDHPDASTSPLENFLFSRQGLYQENWNEAANDHLLDLSSRSQHAAEIATKEMVHLRLTGEVDPDRQVLIADTARKLAHKYPTIIEFQNRNSVKGQAFADLITTGSDGDDEAAEKVRAEVDELLFTYIDWTEGNDPHLTDLKSSRAIAWFYRRLGNAGHGVRFNVAGLPAVIAPFADQFLNGFASALVAVPGLFIKDPIEHGAEKSDEYLEDQRTLAFMILARRNPDAALAIANRISSGEMPADGRITEEMWENMPTVPNKNEPSRDINKAADEFNDIMLQIEFLWFIPEA